MALACLLQGIADHENKVLPVWPSTLSELNSDFTTGRGRIFFGFLLIAPLLVSRSGPEQQHLGVPLY